MSNDDYALLRTLAARPIAVLLPAIEPRMAVLSAAGYVTRTQDGWIATSTGCSALEAEPGRRSRLHKSYSSRTTAPSTSAMRRDEPVLGLLGAPHLPGGHSAR